MVKSDSTSIPEVPFPGVGDRAEHNGTCHDALEVYAYSCFIIVDEKSAHEILQLAPQKFFFHQTTSIHRTNAHIDSPSVTTYLLCRFPSPNLESCHTINIAIPFGDNSLFVRFNMFKNF
jgi:hypothetical protein